MKPALLFQVMDLLVLFIFHSTNANQSRRGAERVLKAKVRTGMIQEALLQRTFRDYAQVTYYPPTENYCLYQSNVLIMVDDTSGAASVFPLYPGSGSDRATLARPLHGVVWWKHVPALICGL